MINHLNIKVFGQVQGVIFRVSAKEKANKLNLQGFVRNEPDGTVYIEAEGDQKDLDQFITWCKNGPEFAKVSKVETASGALKNFNQFSIN